MSSSAPKDGSEGWERRGCSYSTAGAAVAARGERQTHLNTHVSSWRQRESSWLEAQTTAAPFKCSRQWLMGTRCLLSSWLCSMSSLCPHRRVCLPSRLKHRQLLLFSPCCPQGTLLTPAVPTELRSALLSVSPSAAMEVPGAVPPSLLAQRTLLPSGVSWAYELSQRTKGKEKKEREKPAFPETSLFIKSHLKT